MRPPEKRKPVAGKATGSLVIEALAGKIDTSEDSPNPLHLQALGIRRRFAVSWPVARLTAELHFGGAA